MARRSLSLLLAPTMISACAGAPSGSGQLATTRASTMLASSYVATYEGTWKYYGHFSRPGEYRLFPTRAEWTRAGDRVGFDWTIYMDASKKDKQSESTIVDGDKVWHRNESGWNEITGCEGRWLRNQALQGVPELFARLPESDVVRNHHVRSVRFPFAHERLGDVDHMATYDGYQNENGVAVPWRIAISQYEPGEPNELQLSLAGPVRVGGISLEPPPQAPSREPKRCVDSAPATPSLSLQRLADHVWTIDIETTDSRALVVESADHLTVLEAPVSSAIGEAMLDVLANHFIDKPVRSVLIGHYHPHYSGAVRAFVAAGATIIATKQVAAQVRDLAERQFTRQPDQLARTPRRARIKVIENRWVSADGRVVAIDIGAQSNHTDEYLVFYVPSAGLLFQGDLGWFSREGATRAGSRARGLVSALDERGVTPTRFVQSWPVHGNPRELSGDELRRLLRESP